MTLEEKKEAKRLYDIEYRKNNAIKIAEAKQAKYLALTDDERRNINKLRYAKLDKGKKKKDDKDYAIKNKTVLNKKKKKWAAANKEKVRIAKTKHFMNKLNQDPLFKLKHNIGCAIRQAFKRKGYTKNSKTFIILGCTYEEFNNYIMSKWEPWMNWLNYGVSVNKELSPNNSWDIDHIEPLSNAITEDDIIRLNHYTNLQPLCSYYNRFIKKDNF